MATTLPTLAGVQLPSLSLLAELEPWTPEAERSKSMNLLCKRPSMVLKTTRKVPLLHPSSPLLPGLMAVSQYMALMTVLAADQPELDIPMPLPQTKDSTDLVDLWVISQLWSVTSSSSELLPSPLEGDPEDHLSPMRKIHSKLIALTLRDEWILSTVTTILFTEAILLLFTTVIMMINDLPTNTTSPMSNTPHDRQNELEWTILEAWTTHTLPMSPETDCRREANKTRTSSPWMYTAQKWLLLRTIRSPRQLLGLDEVEVDCSNRQ
jgi:hypothetical protein